MTAAHVARSASGAIVNALTFDVEDYFQVQAFADVVSRQDWDRFPSRVEANTARILDLLADTQRKATFFVLGWVAVRSRALIRRIVAEGHELASHGWEHRLVHAQSPDEFRADIVRTKAALEDIGGVPVKGFRAATFSLHPDCAWAFAALEDAGHAYSSSVYPVASDLYSAPHAPRVPYRPPGASDLVEIPIATLRAGGRNWPCGGGGYFRLAPYAVSRSALRYLNDREARPAVFYLHPWEFDPSQPRIAGAGFKSIARHYLNLSRTGSRLARLLRDFAWDRMDRVFDAELAAGRHERTRAR